MVLFLGAHPEHADAHVVLLHHAELSRRHACHVTTRAYVLGQDASVAHLHLHHAADHAECLADDLLEGRQRQLADLAVVRLDGAHRVAGEVDQHVFTALAGGADVRSRRIATLATIGAAASLVPIHVDAQLLSAPRHGTGGDVTVVVRTGELVAAGGHLARRDRCRHTGGGGRARRLRPQDRRDGRQEQCGQGERKSTTHGLPPQAGSDTPDTRALGHRFRTACDARCPCGTACALRRVPP